MTWHVRGLALWCKIVNSLSGRLLALTCLFVLFSEALIFAPLIGHRYRELMESRIQAAESAVLPFTQEHWYALLDTAKRRMMLDRLDADSVVLTHTDYKELYLVGGRKPPIDRIVDMSDGSAVGRMVDGLDCLLHGGNRTLLVEAPTRIKGAKHIAVVLNEASIRAALVDYVMGSFVLGLIILIVTATPMYISLYSVLVAPMRRIIHAMAAFRDNPGDARRILTVSDAAVGELGQAERELSAMQRDLYAYLQQTARLAALGAAVARIQHDLRNILATAQLNSDRLSASEDPAVKKLAPGLVAAIDRATRLAGSTLKYVRSQEHPPQPSRFALAPLIEEAVQAAVAGSTPRVDIAVEPTLAVTADREQAFRAVLNLLGNAVQVLAGRTDGTVAIAAASAGDHVALDIADNGPGIADGARAKLFQPFALSSDKGSGLGLAIARELMRGNGGDVTLVETGTSGTRFRITLPEGSP